MDGAGRKITLAGGDTLAYDRLLIATGSHPVSPPIPGIDSEGVPVPIDWGARYTGRVGGWNFGASNGESRTSALTRPGRSIA